MRHIISVILEDEAGALSRVAGLFTQRGFNIESLTVAQTNDPTLSRMTIVSSGSERVLEQIVKQLNKLIEVVKVSDLTSQDHVERELMLAKISSTSKEGVDLKELVEIFGCKVVDVKDALLKKMGQKKLIIDLHTSIKSIPILLKNYHLELNNEGNKITYNYDAKKENTGITSLLQTLRDEGLKLKDINTEQSSLENIFINLVKGSNDELAGR